MHATVHRDTKRAAGSVTFASGNSLRRKGAEEGGFEPPVPCGTLVFKTSAFGHSATPPKGRKAHTYKALRLCDQLSFHWSKLLIQVAVGPPDGIAFRSRKSHREFLGKPRRELPKL